MYPEEKAMRKLFYFFAFVGVIAGLMAWIIGSAHGLDDLDIDPHLDNDDV